jgi:hypothetical protein
MSHGGVMHRWILALIVSAAALAEDGSSQLRPIPQWKPDLGRAFHDLRRQESAKAPHFFALPQGNPVPTRLFTLPRGKAVPPREVTCSVPLTEVPISKEQLFVMRSIKPENHDPDSLIPPPAPACLPSKK